MTVACWARCTDTGSNFGRRVVGIGDKDSTTHNWGLRFSDVLGTQTIRWAAIGGGSEAFAAATGNWVNNQWHHVAGVEASSTSRFAYLDGSAGSENTTSVSPSGADRISIGVIAESSPNAAEYFTGDIAEVGIWDVALTAAEILSLSKGITPPNIRPANLVFYAPMARDDSAVRDLVGGLSLTLTGTSASAHPRVFRKQPRSLSTVIAPVYTGTIAATLQKAVFAGSGAQVQTGTIAATLQRATAAMSGTHGSGAEGTIAATLRAVTASFTGVMQPSGTVAATLQEPTFAGTGAQTQTGTIAGTLQEPTFAGTGAQVFTGTMAGTLQKATFAGTGAQTQTGTIAATLQETTAALVGVMQPSGVIAVTMQKATFAGAGTHQQIGAIAAALQAATFSGAGAQIQTGTIAGTLRYLTFEGLGVLAMPGFAIVLDSYADGIRLLDQFADGVTLSDARADGITLFDLGADGITVNDNYSNGARLYDGRQ